MRICIDVRLLAKRRPAGIDKYTSFLVDEILKNTRKGEEVALFYNGYRKMPPYESWRGAKEIIEKSWPNRFFDLSSRLFRWPRLDEFIKADVFFSPHFNILALNEPKKRVITFHDLSFIHHPDFYSRRQQFWHWLQHYRRQVGECGGIIAVSDFTKSDLIDYFSFPADRIKRIYSGINPVYRKLEKNDMGLADFRKRRGLAKPFVLYLGSLEARKNINLIIKAFNFIKQDKNLKLLRLILAGSPGWGSETIFEEADASPYRKDILFAGSVSDTEALYFYNSAEVFIYPSFFEGFGFPPLEAQSCGIPVVASDRSSLPEILGSSAVLINPWRVDDLVLAIKSVILDSGSRNKLIQAGFENIKRFSWKKSSLETLKFLRSFA